MKRRYLLRSAATTASSSGATARPAVAASRSSAVGVPRYLAAATAQGGQPLDASTRRTMERRFRRNFSAVRIHTGPAAADAAAACGAEAYALGSHVVFGAGRFAPATAAGQRLLAHELTHVAQQTQPGPVTANAAACEAQADRNAAACAQPAERLAVSAAPIGVQRKPVSPTQTTAPDPGDFTVIDLDGPDWWFVFHAQGFKVVKKLFAPSKTEPGKQVDTHQIGPNWVCNNPGNLTFDPKSIGNRAKPNEAVISKICRDHHAYADTFGLTGIPLAIFPTMADGRAALMTWFAALLTPKSPYWAEVGSNRTAKSIAGAIAEHAPKGHGSNNPDHYAAMVTESINQQRQAINERLGTLPLGQLLQRGKIAAHKTATVAPLGTGAQELNPLDLQAWAAGSEKAEGGTLPGYSWEIAHGSTLPADLAKKLSRHGGPPAAVLAWCAAHRVTVPA
ncbi:eCIS core domain-containing protein [Horticoccus sp. 23ND18S-11]|uniref:eCIS core domain-containing protein n=1 Tax=Horticoccus sp. 23ND18S-11 TaxID=3391832 RepID=UPI0039C9D677